MSVEEYKLLMERSTMYLEEAREALDKGRYDISVFLAEQGLQLFLKAQLLRVLGDYRSPESGTLEWFRCRPRVPHVLRWAGYGGSPALAQPEHTRHAGGQQF